MGAYESFGPPASFAAGVASAFGGWLLSAHEGEPLSHLAHQAILAVPAGMLVAILLGARDRELARAALWSLLGLAAGVLLLLLA